MSVQIRDCAEGAGRGQNQLPSTPRAPWPRPASVFLPAPPNQPQNFSSKPPCCSGVPRRASTQPLADRMQSPGPSHLASPPFVALQPAHLDAFAQAVPLPNATLPFPNVQTFPGFEARFEGCTLSLKKQPKLSGAGSPPAAGSDPLSPLLHGARGGGKKAPPAAGLAHSRGPEPRGPSGPSAPAATLRIGQVLAKPLPGGDGARAARSRPLRNRPRGPETQPGRPRGRTSVRSCCEQRAG